MTSLHARMTVDEITRRLDLGERAVYAMLEAGVIPGIRVGRRWIITRRAYETWEASCGTTPARLNSRDVLLSCDPHLKTA